MSNNKFVELLVLIALMSIGTSTIAGSVINPTVGTPTWKEYGDNETLSADELNNHFDALAEAINDNGAKGNTGDGTGDLTIDTNTDWSTNPPAGLNFGNFTVNSGITLTVPAGTTIRCTGDFTNNGTIAVLPGARGGNGAQSDYTFNYRAFAHPGDSYGAAGNGGHDLAVPASGDIQLWGLGGKGIPGVAAASNYNLFHIGGGGGGAGVSGGDGGGLLKIFCKGAIVNTTAGLIQANGADGANTSGGGGGGIIVLTSKTSIENAGALEANGGNGGISRVFAYGGGGGGGGIMVFVSPNNTNTGTVSVSGGTAGAQTELPTGTYSSGGGGGGACGGDGGIGGSNTNGTVNAPLNGSDGYVLPITGNPESML
jgi:hypothetical protein